MSPLKKTRKRQKVKSELSRSNLVIGLTGPFGSGCSEMATVLTDKSFGFHLLKISDDIRQEVQNAGRTIEKGKPGWRRLLQEYGNKRRKKDSSYWAKKVVEKIDKSDIGSEAIVIDGLRNLQEVQEFRKIFTKFFVVAVCAERDQRWKRVQNDYNGDFNEFKKDDRRDKNEHFPWGQSVQKCVDDADYVYYNNEPLVVVQQGSEYPNTKKIKRTLKEQANDFVSLMRGESNVRGPRTQEIQMAAAYAQSNSSACLKRHVGSVITVSRDGQEFPISMGYNENPPRVPTCSSEGACYKDEIMASKLTARGDRIYCPSCGHENTKLAEPWQCEQCGASFVEWLHPSRNMELCTAIHAEERAIISLGDRPAHGSTLYVTTFPCFQCARMILDAEIERIIYVEAYPVAETAHFLEENGVRIEPFNGFTARAFFKVFPKVN